MLWQLRGDVAVLAFLFGVALFLRLISLSKGIWLDEYNSSLSAAMHDSLLGTLRALRGDNQTPVYFVLLHVLTRIGTGEELLRLLSVTFGFGTVVVVALWLWPYSRTAACLAALILGTMPVVLRYSQEIRPYALLMFATSCAYFCASRISEHPRHTASYVGLALSLMAAVSTHLAGVFLIPAVLVFIGLSPSRSATACMRRSAVVAVVPIALFFFYYVVYLQQLPTAASWWMPAASNDVIAANFRYLFGVSATAWYSPGLDLVQVITIRDSWLILPIILVITLIAGLKRPGIVFLISAMADWLGLIVYSHIGPSIFLYRTALPGLIPFIGAVVVGIDDTRPRSLRFGLSLALAALSVIAATRWITSEAWQPIEEWERVSRLVSAEWKPGSAAIFFPGYVAPLIRYYVPKIPSEASALIPAGADSARVAALVKAMASSGKQSDHATPLFLIVRGDLTAQREFETFGYLASSLRIFGPRKLYFYFIACSDVNIRSDLADFDRVFFERLKRDFGLPESQEHFGSYSFARFRIEKERENK